MKHRTKPSPPSNVRPSASATVRTGPNKPARHITAAASLWLDFFQSYSSGLVAESESRANDQELIERAAVLANLALAAYEERWPGVEP